MRRRERPRHLPAHARRRAGAGLVTAAVAVVALAAPALADPSPAPDPSASSAPPHSTPGAPDGSPKERGSPKDPGHAPKPEPHPSPPPADGAAGAGPAWFDIEGQVREAINGFLISTAKKGLRPAMDALGRTVLATPDLTGDTRVRQIWTGSLVVVNAGLVLFVIAGGFLIMTGPSLRTEHGLKEILPRIGVAAMTANLSLLLIDKAIVAANAVTAAIARRGADAGSMAAALREIVSHQLAGQGFLFSVLALAITVMALVVVATFVLRVMLMVTLIGLAPLALACHALPQTEQLAYTWWRSLAACLAIQIAQAVVLVAALRVFLTPHGRTLLGVPSTSRGLLGLLVCLTMLWLLVKIPFWMRHHVLAGLTQDRRGGIVRRVVGTILAIKTLGGLSRLAASRRMAAPARTPGRLPAPNRSGAARAVPRRTRPSPRRAATAGPTVRRAGPAGFSHAPATHAPLPKPAGHNAGPGFSHPPTGQPLRTALEARPSPAVFSHPTVTRLTMPNEAMKRASGPSSAVFSHRPATHTPARSGASSGASRLVRFSHTPPRQAAPKRPPAPLGPVFSHPTPKPTRRRYPGGATR